MLRNRNRGFQSNRASDHPSEILNGKWDLEQIAVQTHDHGHVANARQQKFDGVQANDEIDALFLRPLPGRQQHPLR